MKQVLIILIVAVTIGSCCNSEIIGSYDLTSEELSIQPYKGGEHLIFTNQDQDTLTFEVSPPVMSITKRPETYNEQHCNPDYWNFQNQTTNLRSLNSPYSFEIILKMEKHNSVDTITKLVSFQGSYFISDNEKSLASLGPFLVNDTLLNLSDYSDSIYTYHYTLILGGSTFTNIYEFNLKGIVKVNADLMEKLYYSKSIGIIGFVMRENGLWVLKESL